MEIQQPSYGLAYRSAPAPTPYRADDSTVEGITHRISILFDAGLSLRETSKTLGLSRNKTAFLAFRGNLKAPQKSLAPEEHAANFNQPPALPSQKTGHLFKDDEIFVLKDLIVRQGCTLETATRTMAIFTRRPVSHAEITAACDQHGFKSAPSDLREKILPMQNISNSSNPSTSIAPILAFAPAPAPAPTAAAIAKPAVAPTQAPTPSVTILQLKSHHCRSITGRAKSGLALYCAEATLPAKSYCAACHSRYFVKAPPIELRTKNPKSRVATSSGHDRPVNRYREVARAIEARAQIHMR